MLRTAIAWGFSIIFWVVFLLAYLCSLRAFPDSWIQEGARFWGRVVLKILGIELERVNDCTLDDLKPRVVVCNHQSALDLVWGATIYPPRALAIGKKEVLYVPLINLVWWALGFVRIDRGNTRKAIESLDGIAEKIVRESRSLMLAPEGTRTPDGSILPFKKGAFHIAIQSSVPIYPVVVYGAFEIMPKTAFIPRRKGKLKLLFLPPIETAGLSMNDLDSLKEKVRQEMQKAYSSLTGNGT